MKSKIKESSTKVETHELEVADIIDLLESKGIHVGREDELEIYLKLNYSGIHRSGQHFHLGQDDDGLLKVKITRTSLGVEKDMNSADQTQ
jgi:hypothetical protein